MTLDEMLSVRVYSLESDFSGDGKYFWVKDKYSREADLVEVKTLEGVTFVKKPNAPSFVYVGGLAMVHRGYYFKTEKDWIDWRRMSFIGDIKTAYRYLQEVI